MTCSTPKNGAMDELAKAQQHQARCQDEVKGCRENLDAVVRDLTNFGALLEVACDDLADAGTKTIDLKRKADDATKEHVSAEEELNDSSRVLGRSREGHGERHTCSVQWSSRQRQQRSEVLARGPRRDRRVPEPFLPAWICGPGDHGRNSGGKAAVKHAWTSASRTQTDR